jgi:1-acyl-sn-glycerol-3-phosphate acyltransferase
MKRFFDATLGKWVRHLFFVLVRTYYAMFYNVSAAGKHLLQDQPGTLILATHVSRHDGPLVSAILYSTARVRPTVHYDEYHNWAQWLPMYVAGAIPMSSPKSWPDDQRAARKDHTLGIIHKVLGNGNSILLFPAGKVRRQPQEIIAPYLSGVYDILRAEPDTPVMLLRLDGLGQFQRAQYDGFWSFLGIKKGHRHVSLDLRPITDLDPTQDLAVFNQTLEALLNS